MDDELAAAITAAVGRSELDQLSSQLTDLADVLGLYVQRLHRSGFTKGESREMAREWYSRYLWWSSDEE